MPARRKAAPRTKPTTSHNSRLHSRPGAAKPSGAPSTHQWSAYPGLRHKRAHSPHRASRLYVPASECTDRPEPAFACRPAAVGNPPGVRLARSPSGPVRVPPSGQRHSPCRAGPQRQPAGKASATSGSPSPRWKPETQHGHTPPAHPNDKPWDTATDHRSPPASVPSEPGAQPAHSACPGTPERPAVRLKGATYTPYACPRGRDPHHDTQIDRRRE